MPLDDSLSYAPSLPLWVQLFLTIVLSGLLLWSFIKMQDPAARFVAAAAWVRYIVSSYHLYTFPPSPLGPSIASIASLAMTVIGLFILRRRNLSLTMLVPIYVIMMLSLVSGILSGDYGGLFAAMTKFVYLVVIIICMMEALDRCGDRILNLIVIGFTPPYVFQLASILFNVPKQGESDGSVSYIGGYGHEGSFSEMLLSAMLITGLSRRMNPAVRTTLMLLGICGVVLANYRTTIIAFAPFFLLVLTIEPIRRFSGPVRAGVLSLYALMLPLALILAGPSASDRFEDLKAVTRVDELVTRSPLEFNREQRQLMSGRFLIWARYVSAWQDGNVREKLVGFGPEARTPAPAAEGGKDLYAHNTLISALYEYGILGFFAYLVFFGAMVVMAFRTPPDVKARTVAAAISIIILNMSTMPMWQFEGIILTGLVWGYIIHMVKLHRYGPRQIPARNPISLPVSEPALQGPVTSLISTSGKTS